MDGTIETSPVLQQSPPNYSGPPFLTPLAISMAGIMATCLAIIAYHLLVVRFCMREQASTTSGLEPSDQPMISSFRYSNGLIGVQPKVLITIPILSYRSTKKEAALFHVDQSECVICLGELEDEDMVRLLPYCKHAFHVPCIDNWFLGHTSCPICRTPVVVVDHEESVAADHVTTDLTNNIDNERETTTFGDRNAVVDDDDHVSVTGAERHSETLVRHSLSLVLPLDGKRRCFETGLNLKRSLSMDQFYVLVHIQSDHDQIKQQESSSSSSSSTSSSSSSSSKSILMASRSHGAQSMRELVRSFSLLRMGRSCTTSNEIILPY